MLTVSYWIDHTAPNVVARENNQGSKSNNAEIACKSSLVNAILLPPFFHRNGSAVTIQSYVPSVFHAAPHDDCIFRIRDFFPLGLTLDSSHLQYTILRHQNPQPIMIYFSCRQPCRHIPKHHSRHSYCHHPSRLMEMLSSLPYKLVQIGRAHV